MYKSSEVDRFYYCE